MKECRTFGSHELVEDFLPAQKRPIFSSASPRAKRRLCEVQRTSEICSPRSFAASLWAEGNDDCFVIWLSSLFLFSSEHKGLVLLHIRAVTSSTPIRMEESTGESSRFSREHQWNHTSILLWYKSFVVNKMCTDLREGSSLHVVELKDLNLETLTIWSLFIWFQTSQQTRYIRLLFS